MRLAKISLAVLLSLSLFSCKKKTIDKTTSNNTTTRNNVTTNNVTTKKNTTTKSKTTTKQNVTTNSVEEKLYKREGNTIYFGSYPQMLEKDESIIEELNSLTGTLPTMTSNGDWKDYFYYTGGQNGIYEISPGCFKKSDYSYAQMWYKDIDYDNDSRYDYRGVYFLQYRSVSTQGSSSGSAPQYNQYKNGYSIDNVYWFKYEPIKWNILEEKNGKAMLISDLIIDSQQYYATEMDDETGLAVQPGIIYENNYELSDIRKWLNDDFYNTVFIDLEREIIETTTVDNSANTFQNYYKDLECNNTDDKVFLLSYQEAVSYYQENEDRITLGTDYALSQGLTQGVNSQGIEGAFWFLRSPYAPYRYAVSMVYYNGAIMKDAVIFTFYGIRPALWIKL
ncbi:MAG: hypothetical protein J6Y28_05280 [Acholeplasmatales bacterium]|nr:hypothetical protein [Acholeplasmatales bacterium]